jgi:hypothetical protein
MTYQQPQQTMKTYVFSTWGGRRRDSKIATVTVSTEAVIFSRISIFRSRRQYRKYPKQAVAAVSVQPGPRGGCQVTLTGRDGSILLRTDHVKLPAAEVSTAFGIRGYPGPQG